MKLRVREEGMEDVEGMQSKRRKKSKTREGDLEGIEWNIGEGIIEGRRRKKWRLREEWNGGCRRNGGYRRKVE